MLVIKPDVFADNTFSSIGKWSVCNDAISERLPSWTSIIFRNFSNACPDSINSFCRFKASFSLLTILACCNNFDPSVKVTSIVSLLPSFLKQYIASFISHHKPAYCPKGWSMLLKTISDWTLKCSAISCINAANSFPSSSVFINAPLPILISITKPWIPSAIFLLIIDPHIRGIEATVPVTSRSAYIFLSAGHISSVCPIIEIPISLTFLLNWSRLIFVL